MQQFSGNVLQEWEGDSNEIGNYIELSRPDDVKSNKYSG